MICIINENANLKNKEHMKKYSVMKWYPIVQIVCSLPATVNRLYDIITKSNNFWLMLIQAFFDGIEGLMITIIFLLEPEIKHSLKFCFLRIFNKNRNFLIVRENETSFIDSDFSQNELESKYSKIENEKSKMKSLEST